MHRTATTTEIFMFTEPAWSNLDLSGYHVEANDGEIGTVDDGTYEIGTNALIVDTGPWIFGTKVMLPVGVINRIDEGERRIWVNLTKEQIKNAPEFDENMREDLTYRDRLGTYYGEWYDREGGL